ncbi:hypothetical protein NIES4071_74180 [Calothrix sp. NIES-4071]|nr:hypothetical protein NIES4071_74180 [Calothrix sp. NIES-4071]BAZ61693.1 hypothetical protein NIES4105_74130 [Calothrix sp. NIES-4105]
MVFRLVMTSLSCIVLTSCSANAVRVPQSSSIPESASTIQLSAENTKKTDIVTGAIDSSKQVSFDISNEEFNKGTNESQQISTEPAYTGNGNYMRLTRTEAVNNLGNPIYKLTLYVNGQEDSTYRTVSGRAHTQNKDRNRSGTEAPLPDGEYRVATSTKKGTIVEAGKLFLPIYPNFRTGRTALGIHVDPSFNQNNGEDGTSGCIGLTNQEDLNEVLEYVRTYRPKLLEVKI